MSRVITSPIKRWSGTVTLVDPIPFPQYMRFKEALREAEKFRDDNDRFSQAILPGIFACVEQWELKNFTNGNGLSIDTFPATPRRSSDKLIVWLITEIGKIMFEADDLPNESRPAPTDG